MIIHNYFYDDESNILSIEFSTKNDGDEFYRILELDFNDVEYYSPIIIYKKDLNDIDEDFIVDLLETYLKTNDLPEQLSL